MYFTTSANTLITILIILPSALSSPAPRPTGVAIPQELMPHITWYRGKVVNDISQVDKSPGALLHDPNGCTGENYGFFGLETTVPGKPTCQFMANGNQYFNTNWQNPHPQFTITLYEEPDCEGEGTVLTLFDQGKDACNRAEKGDQVPIVVKSFKYEAH
ncbi:MAG: hypothetical protein M1812_007163 [Candelaria pacifica]|nr:MAG: hypothetical protein M1812_007163 [Candelaria pacifica]